jgi:hypothetical protein
VFGENVALSESLLWLRELNYRRLEGAHEESELLNSLTLFVNQPGFLPNDVRLKGVTSKATEFEDANGSMVPVEDLGDGYRSILSMTFELIRQLNDLFTTDRVFSQDRSQVVAPGVVLIDEVDAHLHPNWQKEIGFWLTRHFPNIQFVVTTHSPLVCHAATSGSIFRLPAPGSDETARFVDGTELKRLLYGDILDGLSTSAFGVSTTRSEESYHLQNKLADLNLTELEQPLNQPEKAEQESLRQMFPTDSGVLPLKRNDSNS